jgi:hypothetical protein
MKKKLLFFVEILLFLSAMALPSITFAADNGLVVKYFGPPERSSVKIYQNYANFWDHEDVYRSEFEKIFSAAHSDGVKYLFLPKFGLITYKQFFDGAVAKFDEFLDKNPGSKLNLILVSYDKDNDLFPDPPTRLPIKTCMNNIIDILIEAYCDNTYTSEMATFIPFEGVLGEKIKKLLETSPERSIYATIAGILKPLNADRSWRRDNDN